MEKGINLHTISCPICGNQDLQKVSDIGQFGLQCFVSICPEDGLVFLSPRWTKERYMHFYQYEYDSYYRPKVLSQESEDEKYNNIKQICIRLENLNLIKNKNSVLDIGAGMGWSLHWLKNNYTNFNRFSAIESSNNCIQNLKNIIGVDVISNDIDSDWSSNEFDFVILRHVLEHVLNPVEALSKIAENLSPDGILYVAVPDMMNPKGSLNKYWFRTVHTFYYSEMTLLSIASLAGLQPLIIKSENSELWGVFQKAKNPSQIKDLKNVFEEQIKVIQQHKKKNFFPEVKRSIIQSTSLLLPDKILRWLLNQYQGFKK